MYADIRIATHNEVDPALNRLPAKFPQRTDPRPSYRSDRVLTGLHIPDLRLEQLESNSQRQGRPERTGTAFN
jgi:hypothetical protein